MNRLYKTIGVLVLTTLVATLMPAAVAQSQQVVHPPQPPRHPLETGTEKVEGSRFVIPEGTPISVRPIHKISSTTHSTGAIFEAILDQEIKVDDEVVLPVGTRVYGEVVDSLRGGRVKGKAELTVVLREIEIDVTERRNELIETNPITVTATGSKVSDAKKVGVAAGIGAIIGAIAGGKKGAAVGATIGGGAQTARVMTSRGDAAEIDKEQLITFRLEHPLELAGVQPTS